MRQVRLQQEIDTLLQSDQREYRWGAAEILPDPLRWNVVGGELEWRGVTEPPIEGLRGLPLVTCCSVDEGRRTRPTIEILVAAADCEIRPRSIEIHRHRACRMGQIPDRQP